MPFRDLNRKLALCCLVLSVSSVGSAAKPPTLSATDNAEVARAVAYLESLSSARGRFEQIDSRGEMTTGTFFIQRPGRARFDYDPPSGLVIASNGFKVTVVNRRLKTIESYPLGLTPLGLFLNKTIRLDRGVFVSGVDHIPGGFVVTAQDAQKHSQGAIAMTFAEQPIRLAGWTIIDARGGSVRVHLANLAPASPQGWQFFELADPSQTTEIQR